MTLICSRCAGEPALRGETIGRNCALIELVGILQLMPPAGAVLADPLGADGQVRQPVVSVERAT